MEKYARSIYRINRDISALEYGEDESREDDNEDINEILKETEVEKLDDKDTVDICCKEYKDNKDSIPKESEDSLHEDIKTNENEMKKSIDNTEDASEHEKHYENEKYKDEKLIYLEERSKQKESESPDPVLVRIPRHYTIGSGRSSHVEYEVELMIIGGEEGDYVRKIFRRFSEFRDLHRRLARHGAQGKNVAKLIFPNRKIFFSLSTSVSNSRQKDLQSYLSNMLDTCCISSKEELDVLDIFFRAT